MKSAYASGTLGIKIGQQKASENNEALKKAYNLGKKIALDIKNKKKYAFQNFFAKLIIKLALKPTLKKFIIKEKDARFKGVYSYLQARSMI